jgi:hypothetical protein
MKLVDLISELEERLEKEEEELSKLKAAHDGDPDWKTTLAEEHVAVHMYREFLKLLENVTTE